jgi:hypothetical protein
MRASTAAFTKRYLLYDNDSRLIIDINFFDIFSTSFSIKPLALLFQLDSLFIMLLF